MNKFRTAALATAAAAIVAAVMIFAYAPEDVLQGPAQKIFYLHVSAAIAAFICFGLVLGGSVAYLWRESLAADRLARAATHIGLLFTAVTLAMGIVWAKTIWNWDPSQTWDARFTSTVVLGAVYAGYLMVRRFANPGRSAARLSAVVGIIGFADLPIVYFSVQWWRTLHPGPVLAARGGPALPAEMLLTWMVTLFAVLLLTAVLIAARYRVESQEDQLLMATADSRLPAAGPAVPLQVR